MPKNAHEPTILRGIVGSHAYGINHAGSDIDRAEVYVADARRFLGLSPAEVTSYHKAVPGADDVTRHEVGKFLSLCLKANPTVTELLWLPGYEVQTAEGVSLVELREACLSAKGVRNAYLGYATAQLKGAQRGKAEASRAKFGRHLYRLVHQGVSLHLTGQLELRIPDREHAFAFGERAATGDLSELEALLAWAEQQFELPTPLPEQPNRELVENQLVAIRLASI